MSLLSLRRHLVALLLVATLPVIAFADDAAIDRGFAIMSETDDEEAFYRAAQDIAALGPVIVPNLTRRLIEAETDDQRIDLTYLLAVVLDQARFAGETVELPPELMPEIATLMKEPSEPAVQGNLANLASHFVPQPPEITEGLLSILSRAEHEGLRATTSAIIAMYGDEDVLPLVHEALRGSDSDRYSGDLALILRGTELPQDIVGILETLLTSDNAEARQTASRVLTEAGIRNPAQLDTALRDLDAADTDMKLLNAAMAVREHTDGSERVAEALGTALGQARRMEERGEIIRALAASGDAGLDRLYRIIRSTEDPELLGQFILGMNSTTEARDNPRTLEMLMAMAIESEDPDIADAAAFGLNLHGAAAVSAIDAVLAHEQTDDALRERLSPVRDRLAKSSETQHENRPATENSRSGSNDTQPAPGQTVLDEEAARAALGLDGSGRFAVTDITKACPFIEPILESADPTDRILIMTDTNMDAFSQGSCGDACDMLTLNNVIVECQQETGVLCAPIAGIHDGTLYDLSYDMGGGGLADCGF